MLDTNPTIQRFSRHIVVRDRASSGSPIYQSVRLLQSLMQSLIEGDKKQTIEGWSHLFLKGILRDFNGYELLIRHFLTLAFVKADRFTSASSSRLEEDCEGLKDVPTLVILHYALCQRFLFCYLQPICWTSALRVSRQLKRSPNTALHYPHLDCFAIACYQSTRPGTLLRRFDFRSSHQNNRPA